MRIYVHGSIRSIICVFGRRFQSVSIWPIPFRYRWKNPQSRVAYPGVACLIYYLPLCRPDDAGFRMNCALTDFASSEDFVRMVRSMNMRYYVAPATSAFPLRLCTMYDLPRTWLVA